MSRISSSYQEVINFITKGGVVVLPTDTIYGVVASALNPGAVERLYGLKRRSPQKPPIILIADYTQLERFNVAINPLMRLALDKHWPGPTSVILPCPDPNFAYLHRGTLSLAFRLPKDPTLKQTLINTDPLIAPSANPEGMPPAQTIAEAQAYFGNQIDSYVDGGTITATPSRLIRMNSDATYEVLRP